MADPVPKSSPQPGELLLPERPQRVPRIPLFTPVRISGALAAVGHTLDVSAGGIGLVVQMDRLKAAASHTPVNSLLELELRLPADKGSVELTARVAWLGRPTRDPHGLLALRLGVSFDPSDQPGVERIAELVESFRYGVAIVGDVPRDLIEEALADTYQVEWMDGVDHLTSTASRQLGLILVGDCGSPALTADAVDCLLTSPAVKFQPPIVVCTSCQSDRLTNAIKSSSQLLYQPMPLRPLQLRSLARRCVEGHMVSIENERLNALLTSMVDRLRQENEYLRVQATPQRIGGLIGDSVAIQEVCAETQRIAKHDVSVLLAGETGTGKTTVARAIQEMSTRKDQPFVSQNCAALADTLLDSELFGHVRGAFTGAVDSRIGLFESCDNGTVLLDEIGEMSPSMQAKILDVLESGCVRRVGGTKRITVNVRLICATHRDLLEMVREGSFREDLYYRLCSFVIHIPPLRERPEDIAPLAMHFLAGAAARYSNGPTGFTEEALALLEVQPWPGNVRQLKQTIERLAIVCPSGQSINAAEVQAALGATVKPREQLPAAAPIVGSLRGAVTSFERSLIERVLAESNGNLSEAARLLQIDRTTLTRRCQRLGILRKRKSEPLSLSTH